jgi:regulator of sirC expression with transglutaminase-like and TPR domain
VEREQRFDMRVRIEPFRKLMAADDANLDDMSIALSFALQPDLDRLDVLTELDMLAAECPTPTRDGVMGYLFGSDLFEGDRSDYHRWQNSCIDQVVRSRRGMPITLAIVAIEVARRVGVSLTGVGVPGHFLVGDPTDPEWFADPFHGTFDLSPRDCEAMMSAMGIASWSDRYLTPTAPRLVIARVLNNLKMTCESRGDQVRLAIVMKLRQVLPEFPDEVLAAQSALAILN